MANLMSDAANWQGNLLRWLHPEEYDKGLALAGHRHSPGCPGYINDG